MMTMLALFLLYADLHTPLLAPMKPDPHIQIQSLKADVRLVGFLAETTLTVTVTNDSGTPREAELMLQLPEGAAVDGFSLLVGERFIDGVIVDKEVARITFEREKRKRVDPGLVAWIDGSRYRTRVYPVQSSRTFRVRYLEPLSSNNGQITYRLNPMGDMSLGRIDLTVDTTLAAMPMEVTGHPFGEKALGMKQGVMRQSGDAVVFDRPFVLTSESKGEPLIMVEKGGEGYRYAAAVPIPIPKKQVPIRPKRLALFWDASLSREKHNHQDALDLVERLLQAWDGVKVSLVVFRDGQEKPRRFRSTKALLHHLDDLVYDGGTNLVDLEVPPEMDADLVLLISDGDGNDQGVPAFQTPVLVFNPHTGGNHMRLTHLAQQTGGIYVRADQGQDPVQLTQRFLFPNTLQKTKVLAKGADQPMQAYTGGASQQVIITGRFNDDHARVQLAFGAGDEDTGRVAFRVNSEQARSSSLLARYQEICRLHRLLQFPQYNRNQIIELATRAGLVSSYTSLFSLETVEQYFQYQIEPPQSLPEMRAAWHRLSETENIDEVVKEMRLAHDQAVKAAWSHHQKMLNTKPAAKTPTSDPDAGPRREPQAQAQTPTTTVQGVVPQDHLLTEDMVVVSEAPVVEVTSSITGQDITLELAESLTTTSSLDYSSMDLEAEHPLVEHAIAIVSKSRGKNGGKTRLGSGGPFYPQDLMRGSVNQSYRAYLDERAHRGQNPSFYFECALWFFDQGHEGLGFQILSNLLELGWEDPALLKTVAWVYQEKGRLDDAQYLLEWVADLRPELPQSRRDLALVLAEQGRQRVREKNSKAARAAYHDALTLLAETISQPWGDVPKSLQLEYVDEGRFKAVLGVLLTEYNRILLDYRAVGGKSAPVPVPFEDDAWEDPIGDVGADIRVVLDWDQDNVDVDLWVTEPGGVQVSYNNTRSENGGFITQDNTEGYGPEVYTIKQAQPGLYHIQADYYGRNGFVVAGSTTVRLTLFTNYGRDNEVREMKTFHLKSVKEKIEAGTIKIEAPLNKQR